MSDVLTIRQAAADWPAHYWTVWRLCRTGQIPGVYRVGASPERGHYRIPRRSWEAFKRTRLVAAPRGVPARGHLIDRVLGAAS